MHANSGGPTARACGTWFELQDDLQLAADWNLVHDCKDNTACECHKARACGILCESAK